MLGGFNLKKNRSSMVGIMINIVLIGLAIYLVPKVTMYAYHFARDFVLQPAPKDKLAKEVNITIPNGASTRQIATILKHNGLILNEEVFTIKVKLSEYDGTFKKGDYTLNTSMTEEQIMEALKLGTKSQEGIKFTIPEGYSTLKIAKKLEDEGIVKADDFLKAVNEGKYDYAFLAEIPQRASRLEGYLFPDTYFFRKEITAQEIVSKLLNQFESVYSDAYKQKASGKGYTMDQMITIASIVEKEAKLAGERPTIAGVIYNRLNINMALQMDSTVNYAFELKYGVDSGRDEKKVLLDDLEIKSAYNTYANTGLPIGPICNPGRESIEAALNPQQHDYIYFVLKDAQTGEHIFTKTHDEHVAAKNKYKALETNK
jgi:UPF0755 protein